MTPKRIVHCANFNTVRLKGCYMTSMGYKLTNGLTRLGHQVLTYGDRDIAKIFGLMGHKMPWSMNKANDNFYNFCLNTKPDVILLGHADTIYPETLQKIREALKDVTIIQWNVDNVNPEEPSAMHNIKQIKQKIDLVDYTFITTADKNLLSVLDLKKNKVFYLPNPVDASIEKYRVYEEKKPTYDLFFAASPNTIRDLGGEIVTSKEVADFISNNVKDANMLFPRLYHPSLDGISYIEALSKSAMVLNMSRNNSDYLYSSDRMAHAMGNGCLALIDERTGFKDIFNDDEAAFYSSKENLIEKINYYTKNPEQRQLVAKNGWRRYHELFNEKALTEYMMSVVDNTFDSAKYPYPTLIK